MDCRETAGLCTHVRTYVRTFDGRGVLRTAFLRDARQPPPPMRPNREISHNDDGLDAAATKDTLVGLTTGSTLLVVRI